MSGSRSLSSIYFLLNDEDDFATDEKEEADTVEQATSTTTSSSDPPKRDKAALAFITHPPPPSHATTEVKGEPLEESHPRALPATHGWVHSPLSTTPFGHPSGGPFAFLRARSLPTSSLWRGASADHARQPTARDYHPRSTSWPESGGMAGSASDSGLGHVSGASSGAMPSPASTASFPTSPHVHSSHVSNIPATWSYGVPVAANHSPIVTAAPIASPSSTRAMSSPPGSSPSILATSLSSSSFSSSPSAAATSSSAMSFHSLSAPTSPLSAVGRGTGRSPSPPLPSSPAARMPSPPPSSSIPSWSLTVGQPETQPAVGDVSYNKCLQLWTKQTEQRRSHQRVKRWQEFLHRTKTKESDGGAETEQQQWIKSRPKRKHKQPQLQQGQPEPETTNSPTENEDDETRREAKERKRRRKAKDNNNDDEETPQMRASDSEQHRGPEERRTKWDFHILQADDIRGQQDEEEHSARSSRAK